MKINKNFFISIAFSLLSIAALTISLGTAFKALPINPDMVAMALIYHGINQYGWNFLFTWRFTQDNQILSLFPFSTIFYAIAGVSGNSVIIQGWLIFVINGALSGILVKIITRSWKWGGLTWLLSLMASPSVIGWPAIMAYPVSHNSVWAFGLLGTIAIVKYFKDQSIWSLPVILFCVFVGTVSDPWFGAAFSVPLLILFWKSPKWIGIAKQERRYLIKYLIITYISARIVYFILEIFKIVPGHSLGFASPSLYLYHLELLLKSLGIFFFLYPFHASFILILYLSSIFVTIGLILTTKTRTTNYLKASNIFIALSAGIIIAAFILTSFADGIISARFLINIFYFFIVIFVVNIAIKWSHFKKVFRIFPVIVFACYFFIALTTTYHNKVLYSANWNGTKSLVEWLYKNNLKNGFGEYFRTNSPSFEIASHGKVKARPLSCNMGYLIPRLSSGDDQYWFGENSLHSREKANFLIFENPGVKWKNCAESTFGKPHTKLQHGNFNIWIYHDDLAKKLYISYGKFKYHWALKNIENNRKSINKVGKNLGIHSAWAQNAYTWLLQNGLATDSAAFLEQQKQLS